MNQFFQFLAPNNVIPAITPEGLIQILKQPAKRPDGNRGFVIMDEDTGFLFEIAYSEMNVGEDPREATHYVLFNKDMHRAHIFASEEKAVEMLVVCHYLWGAMGVPQTEISAYSVREVYKYSDGKWELC